jgi:hypothetical protein
LFEADRVYVVGLPGPLRASLEQALKNGPFGVTYASGAISIVPGCSISATTKYAYTPFGRKEYEYDVKDEESLRASVPLDVVSLGVKLSSSTHFSIAMALVGQYDLDVAKAPDVYPAACESATHLVVGASIGAFRFASVASKSAGLDAEVWKVGVGAKLSSDTRVMSADGDREACTETDASAEAPVRCSSVVALNVMPIHLMAGTDLDSLFHRVIDSTRALSRPPAPPDAAYLQAAKAYWQLYWSGVRIINVASIRKRLVGVMAQFGRQLDLCGYGPSAVEKAAVPMPLSCAASSTGELVPLASQVESVIGEARQALLSDTEVQDGGRR